MMTKNYRIVIDRSFANDGAVVRAFVVEEEVRVVEGRVNNNGGGCDDGGGA
jgi:hypothetical protein